MSCSHLCRTDDRSFTNKAMGSFTPSLGSGVPRSANSRSAFDMTSSSCAEKEGVRPAFFAVIAPQL